MGPALLFLHNSGQKIREKVVDSDTPDRHLTHTSPTPHPRNTCVRCLSAVLQVIAMSYEIRYLVNAIYSISLYCILAPNPLFFFMNNKTLSILHIGQSHLINRNELINKLKFSYCKIAVVQRGEEYKEKLKSIRPDLILLEHHQATPEAGFILQYLQEQHLKIPVILLLDDAFEDEALKLFDQGLSDYLLYSNLKRLPNAIRQLADKYRLQRQNDQRYQYLYDQNLAGLYTSTAKGVILECNQAFAHMLGFQNPRELIGRHVLDLTLKTSDRQMFLESLRKHRKVFNYRNEVVRKDGQRVYLQENIYLAIDELSGEEICHGIMIDITQMVLTKQNITRARAMLAEAQELASMGNWNYNLLKQELTISAGLSAVLGVDKKERLNIMQLMNMIEPADRSRVFAEISQMSPAKEKVRNSFRVLRKGGKVITVAGVHTRDLDDSGSVLRYYGVIQDISALEAAEQERDKITAELVKRNQALEQFTYVISHNLRAPVANIKALIDILDQSCQGDGENREMLDRMTRSVGNLDEIISDLNLILQVKQQKNAAQEEIDLEAIISSIQLSIKNLILQEQVRFELDLRRVDSFVTIKSYLYSIFYNLTLNSIKYRHPERSPVISISCLEEGSDVLFSFADNGKGIDLKKNANQLFGLYKRFDSSVEGKGMGLFMVKTQVEELGGTIDIESELMKGTAFKIRLPGLRD